MRILSILFFLALISSLGGLVGYLDALVDLDESRTRKTQVIQNELFSLDNKIAQVKYQLRLKENPLLGAASPNPPALNKMTFCSTELNDEIPLTQSSSALEEELSALQKKEKKVWEYSEIHGTLPAAAEKILPNDAIEWGTKIVGKAAEIRKKRKQEQALWAFWSSYETNIPDEIRVLITSYDDETPPINPLHAPQISAALSLMPPGFLARLKTIYIVYGEDHIRRGGSGLGVVFIKGEKSDIFPTLIHEFGHLYDFYFESESGTPSPFHNGIAQLTNDDPSAQFYRMSWENNEVHRGDQEDFCSCYGTSNPQEDFAEAFAMYILQGSTFEAWSQKNPVLKQKYAFIKDIFQGRTFFSPTTMYQRPFSIIDIPVDYQELLNTSPFRST